MTKLMRSFYSDLAGAPRFAVAFEWWFGKIYKNGEDSALRQYLKGI